MRMQSVLVLLAVVGIGSVICGCQSASRTAVSSAESTEPETSAQQGEFQKRFRTARLREHEGDYHLAKSLYEELLQIRPNDAETLHRLGIVEIRLGDAETGLDHLRRAEAAAPDNVGILNDLGFACLTTGRPEVAQQVLLTALELNPRDERAINNLAMAYGLTGQFDKAFATFRRNLTEAEALSNLGYVATQAGDMKFATECYSRALSLDPELTPAAEALAQLADLERQVEQQKAIAAATKRNAAAEGGTEIQLTGGQRSQPSSDD